MTGRERASRPVISPILFIQLILFCFLFEV